MSELSAPMPCLATTREDRAHQVENVYANLDADLAFLRRSLVGGRTSREAFCTASRTALDRAAEWLGTLDAIHDRREPASHDRGESAPS